MISIIVACAANGVIGYKNNIPWHIPDDLKLFKQLTTGSVVIMGRKTWDSIPDKFKPLPNRFNIIISSKGPDYFRQYYTKPDENSFLVASSLKHAIGLADFWAKGKDIFIIGGASIYQEAMNNKIADRLMISHVEGEFEGDTYFKFTPEDWNILSNVPYQGFKFITYTRKP